MACSQERGRIETMQHSIDSLQQLANTQKGDLEDMSTFVQVLSDGIYLLTNPDALLDGEREGKTISKEEATRGLADAKSLMERQRERIVQLETALNDTRVQEMAERLQIDLGRMKNVVALLEGQIEQKNRQIGQLQTELSSKISSIAQLRQDMQRMGENNEKLTETVKKQETVIAVQSEEINVGYLKIGTKSELKSLGLINTGFLRKSSLNTQNIDNSMFQRVDIRKCTEISIPSKKPRILTQMPSSSYRFDYNSDGTAILRILDPPLFWSISYYLVIQL